MYLSGGIMDRKATISSGFPINVTSRPGFQGNYKYLRLIGVGPDVDARG
jgi:hypothetical protein